MVWSNVGNNGENYSNMDDAGTITLDGANDLINVSEIQLTDLSVAVDNDTVQIVPVILPEDASIQTLTWKLKNGTGVGRIDSKGKFVPVKNGTVTLQAFAADGSYVESNVVTITISGQVLQAAELNYIKSGDFSVDGLIPAPWFGSDLSAVVNQIAVLNPIKIGSPWDYKLAQRISVPYEFKDLKYVLTFKAWADSDRVMSLDFEDGTGPLYNRYGNSTDPEANVTNDYTTPGESGWNLNLTTTPTVYKLHVVFDEMTELTNQDFSFFFAEALGKAYIDSVSLYSEDDLALIGATSSRTIKNASARIYPNPVNAQNELNVELSSANSEKVSVFNSLGQKVMEKISTGNIAKFNVAALPKGIYFVKLIDGTCLKFIR